MRDICNYLPSKEMSAGIEYYHFVYEMGLPKLKQPFMRRQYTAHLVFRGEGNLKTDGRDYSLSAGTLFFTFPSQTYCLEGDDNFSYLYITLNGTGVSPLLEQFGITKERYIYYGFHHLLEFWMTSIRRITALNANVLTESVLLYTLSYMGEETQRGRIVSRDRFSEIMHFIDNNFADPDFTIIKVADMFGYNQKYLSFLFNKRQGVKFTAYVNQLRVNVGKRLLLATEDSVSQIAFQCGFADSFYFSKVFKKEVGETPSEYRKNKHNGKETIG